MDIEEYLKQKKALEKKKEMLEAEQDLDKKKAKAQKKELEVTRRREVMDDDDPHAGRRYSARRAPRESSHDKFQMLVIFMAFIAVLVVIGGYFFFMSGGVDKSEPELTEVELLQKELEELKKAMAEENESEPQPSTTTTNTSSSNDDNDTEPAGPGPEFEIELIDDWEDETSVGVFSVSGKIGGEFIELWAGGSGTPHYKYRLRIQNKESSRMKCMIDEFIEIDEDFDGDVDDEQVKLDLHTIEFDPLEEDTVQDSVLAVGAVTAKYEARCFFCEDRRCDELYEDGEEKMTAKLKVLLHSEELSNNSTNSSS